MYNYELLTNVSYQKIYQAFAKAFADYPVPFDMSLEDFVFMIERRGYNPDISFGAFYNEELVGFTLNGLRKWNNVLTAYDTGTGVVKEHRKKGIAKQIFLQSIPVLKEKNIKQYLLEVMDINTPAIDLYKKMGFTETRKLDFAIVKTKEINFSKTNYLVDLEITETLAWNLFKTFWNENPSWQNSIESLNRKSNHFICCVAKHKDEIIGYGFIQKSNGDIPQFAVKKEFRKKGIGSLILKKLSDYSYVNEFRVINSINKDEETNEFLKKIGILKDGGQLEMIMEL